MKVIVLRIFFSFSVLILKKNDNRYHMFFSLEHCHKQSKVTNLEKYYSYEYRLSCERLSVQSKFLKCNIHENPTLTQLTDSNLQLKYTFNQKVFVCGRSFKTILCGKKKNQIKLYYPFKESWFSST